MESFLTYLFSQWPFLALMVSTFLALAISPYGRLWKNDADRKRVMGRLATHGWRLNYTRYMRPVLDGIDATLSKDELDRKLSPKRVAWSHDLILWCLLLAIAYPVLSITGHWIAGDALMLANAQIAPPGDNWARAYVFVWLVGPAALFLLGSLKSRWRLPSFVLAIGILYGGLFLAERFGVPDAVAFAGAFAFAFAVAVAFAVAFAGAVAGAFAFAVAFAGAFAFAVAVAVAVAFAVALLIDRVQIARGRHPAYWITYSLLLLLASSLAILFSPAGAEGRLDTQDRYIVLFLGVFPLINGLADFASVGLTRYLLRQGLDGVTWRKAALDILGGAAIFLLLGITLITYIHLVRFADGTPLMNLTALFEGLRDDPGQYWWLFFMLFSTLIPTVMHGMVGLYTLLLHYPAPVRRWVFARLKAGGEGSDTEGWWGSLGYCAMLTLSIWVPILGTWLLLTANHGAFLQGVIAIFRGYASLIGAI